jgi:SAM-dependent methyltransferase
VIRAPLGVYDGRASFKSMTQERIVVDLGCGEKKRDGTIGVDFNQRTNPDIVHDLNIFPYPFKDSSIDMVYLDNTLEHLDDVIKVMEEVYRILKPGGKAKIITPYFRSVWGFLDPTHKHFFAVNSFSFYDPDHIVCRRYKYTDARFKTKKIRFNETLSNNVLKKCVIAFANRFPWTYEYRISHLYPLDDITYYIEKSK